MGKHPIANRDWNGAEASLLDTLRDKLAMLDFNSYLRGHARIFVAMETQFDESVP